jgi:tRNA(His) 5'-end guanylyltransferase
VDAACAKIGYTQSDEISLVFETTEQNEELLFGGKVQKLCSVLAGMTTAFFVTECIKAGGELADRALNRAPHFDARVFQLPTRGEAVNCFIWREKDATKNAISMAARHYYSHKELQAKRGGEMQEMLFQKGVNFNDYPVRFKRGVFVQSRATFEPLPEETRLKIPEQHRPAAGAHVQRSSVVVLDLPVLSTVVNREAVIFEFADPVVA